MEIDFTVDPMLEYLKWMKKQNAKLLEERSELCKEFDEMKRHLEIKLREMRKIEGIMMNLGAK